MGDIKRNVINFFRWVKTPTIIFLDRYSDLIGSPRFVLNTTRNIIIIRHRTDIEATTLFTKEEIDLCYCLTKKEEERYKTWMVMNELG